MKKTNFTLLLGALLLGAALFILTHQSSTEVPSTNHQDEELDERAQRAANQRKRAELEFKMTRDPRTNKIPEGIHQKEQALALRMDKANESNARFVLPVIPVRAKGPTNFAGRTRALAFDVRSPSLGFSGGVSGKIYKTRDGGLNWSNVHRRSFRHGVTTIAQNTKKGSEDIWFYGTGELPVDGSSASQPNGNPTGDGAFVGTGVYRTTNNGTSWSALSSTQRKNGLSQSTGLDTFDFKWDYVHRVIVDTSTMDGTVYAANANGIYRSPNNGGAFEAVISYADTVNLTSTDVAAVNADIIQANDTTFYAAISGLGIYKLSKADGATKDTVNITKIANANSTAGGLTNLGAGDRGRMVLAAAPNNSNIVYVLYNNAGTQNNMGTNVSCGGKTTDAHLRRYNSATGTWDGNYDDQISICVDEDLKFATQGGYNLAIVVNPLDANEVFIGAERLFKFNVTGNDTGTYTYIGGYQGPLGDSTLHVDQHLLVIPSQRPSELWVANDGGIGKASIGSAIAPKTKDSEGNTLGGYRWQARDKGMVTMQYYGGDITPQVGFDFVGGGAQDNSASVIPHGSTEMIELGGGDGSALGIIKGTTANDFEVIYGIQNGTLFRRTHEQKQISGERFGKDITPFVSDENRFATGNQQGSLQSFKSIFELDSDNRQYVYYPFQSSQKMDNLTSLFRTRAISQVDTTSKSTTDNPATGWEEKPIVGMPQGHEITAMTVSRNLEYKGLPYNASDVNRKLYIGTDKGKVFLIRDPAFATTLTAIDITPDTLVAGSYVSDIAVNPSKDTSILVTVSNYNVPSIMLTDNVTASPIEWQTLDGSPTGIVATASMRSALITSGNPGQTIYLYGSSVGLIGTDNPRGRNTFQQRVGSAEINFGVVAEMRLRTGDNKAVAVTHGDGMFILEFQNECVTTLTLNDNPIPSQGYVVSDKITSSGTVPAGNTVIFDARNQIELLPNFTVLGNFQAKIGGCEPTLQVDGRMEEVRTEVEPIAEMDIKKDVDFALYPSPASGQVTIAYELPEPSQTIITLHDNTGKIVKTIQPNTSNAEGYQQVSFYAGDFNPGIYYVMISTPQIRKTQKLMIVRN